MARSKLSEKLTFNHERMWPCPIDEYGCQILIPGGLRHAVNRYRYRARIWPPALECIEAGEGQQRSTPVMRLKCHDRHLSFLV